MIHISQSFIDSKYLVKLDLTYQILIINYKVTENIHQKNLFFVALSLQPLQFSFTVQHLIGPRQVCNYFEVGDQHPPKRNSPPKKLPLQKKFFFLFKTNVKNWGGQLILPKKIGLSNSTPHPPQMPIESFRGIASRN